MSIHRTQADWLSMDHPGAQDDERLVWAVCEESGQGWPTFARWHGDHWCSDSDGRVNAVAWAPKPQAPLAA